MNELAKARQVITEELGKCQILPVRVLLFGSRARQDCRPNSDWDFYVIVDRELPYSERRKMATGIRQRLAQMEIVADVFIQAQSIVHQRERNTGYLTYYALKEGVEI